jgi:hypothetical protein
MQSTCTYSIEGFTLLLLVRIHNKFSISGQTGIWAIEVSDAFPSAAVVGVDIVVYGQRAEGSLPESVAEGGRHQ